MYVEIMIESKCKLMEFIETVNARAEVAELMDTAINNEKKLIFFLNFYMNRFFFQFLALYFPFTFISDKVLNFKI